MVITENHPRVMNQAGFPNIREYRYWSSETRSIDIDGMINDLENAPEGAAVLLHACAHNPTGCDPTTDQWIRIANTVEVFYLNIQNNFQQFFKKYFKY